MEKTIIDDIIIEKIYSYNGSIRIPDGYEFLQMFVDKEGHMSIAFKKNIPISEYLIKLNKKNEDRINEKIKKLENDYKKKIDNLNIEKTFSEILKNFKIGDTCYFYDNYNSIVDIDRCIKSFIITNISLFEDKIQITNKDDQYLNLYVNGWENKQHWKKIYKTKEDLIKACATQHQDFINELKEKEQKRINEQEQKRINEENEILRKAEEIKNRNK